MVPDFVYKFQIICLNGTEVIEWKPNAGWMDGHADIGKTNVQTPSVVPGHKKLCLAHLAKGSQ